MAEEQPDNAAVTSAEQDDSPIPGQSDSPQSFDTGVSPPSLSAGTLGQQTSAAFPAQQPQMQVDSDKKVHPHMALLAGILNRILGGVRNAPGNPNNAFDRGFMAQSPNQTAMAKATIQKAQSAADLEKMQVSLTGIKLIQAEYMLKRLPQDLQDAHLKTVSDFKQALVKDGAHIEAEGDSEAASDGQALHLNKTDSRATSGAGQFYSLPTMDVKGKAVFDVVFVPNKNTLQEDFKWTDADGAEHVIPKGTPMYGAMAKLVELKGKELQDQTKQAHKDFGDLMKDAGSPEVVDQQLSQLQAMKKRNDPLYQQNKNRVDDKIGALQSAQAGAIGRAQAGATRIEERQLAGKQAVVDTPEGPLMMSAKEAQSQYGDEFTTLSGQQAMKIRDQRANADASLNVLQNYEKTFATTKLTPAEKDAMRTIVLQVQHDVSTNKGGILGDIVEQIPLAGPVAAQLNKYVDRLITGGIQSGSWDALSPKAKTMMTQYFQSVVANFANMKQMLGSVGRNPAMIQAETSTIPLPYLDRQSAQEAFSTKLSDLKQRNSSIPRVKGSRDLTEMNREQLWEAEGKRKNPDIP